MIEKVTERFIRYAKAYTSSNPESKSFPSTKQQQVFMRQKFARLMRQSSKPENI